MAPVGTVTVSDVAVAAVTVPFTVELPAAENLTVLFAGVVLKPDPVIVIEVEPATRDVNGLTFERYTGIADPVMPSTNGCPGKPRPSRFTKPGPLTAPAGTATVIVVES